MGKTDAPGHSRRNHGGPTAVVLDELPANLAEVRIGRRQVRDALPGTSIQHGGHPSAVSSTTSSDSASSRVKILCVSLGWNPELAWAGIIGVPSDCTAQKSTAKCLKSGPFAVVFAGAVATRGRLIKIGFIAHSL
jgi:hypothetical protein